MASLIYTGHCGCEDHFSVSRRLLLDTNLFDVIASLGAGLYVHHIELSSFPLCRLNRNLPATVPGREGRGGRRGRGVGGGVEGGTQTIIKKKIKMMWREQHRKGDKQKTKPKKRR